MNPRRMLWMVFLIFLVMPSGGFALEIGSETGVVIFNPKKDGDTTGHKAIDDLHFFGNIRVREDITDRLDFDVFFEHDPILLNRFVTRFGFQYRYISFNAGPFFGVINSPAQPVNPGITLALNITVPGILFGDLMADTTIGDGMLSDGDYQQRSFLARAGFWIPSYLLVSFTADKRTFIERKEYTNLFNEWFRFYMAAEIFNKNFFLAGTVKFGYEELEWSIANTEGNYALNALYAGLEFSLQVKPFLRILMGAETPVYFWISRNFISDRPGAFLLGAHLGFVWTAR
jgi:hypothetical protein